MTSPPRHILIAEDDDDDFFLISRELAKAGFKAVTRVLDGKAVLEYLSGRGADPASREHPRPDVLFLDLKLPHMLGHDVLRAIRAEPQWRDLRVYVLTGSDEYRDRERIEAVGCDGYFVKPLGAPRIRELFGAR